MSSVLWADRRSGLLMAIVEQDLANDESNLEIMVRRLPAKVEEDRM